MVLLGFATKILNTWNASNWIDLDFWCTINERRLERKEGKGEGERGEDGGKRGKEGGRMKGEDTSRKRIIINFRLADELIYLVIMLKFERLLSSRSSPSN